MPGCLGGAAHGRTTLTARMRLRRLTAHNVAASGAQRTGKPQVGMAASAGSLQRRGHRFESCHPHHPYSVRTPTDPLRIRASSAAWLGRIPPGGPASPPVSGYGPTCSAGPTHVASWYLHGGRVGQPGAGALHTRTATPGVPSVSGRGDRRARYEVQPAEGSCGRQDAGDVGADWRERFGQSTLGMPRPSWATMVAGRRCSGGRRGWGDGVVASREADADVQPTRGHGGCIHGAAVHRGDR